MRSDLAASNLADQLFSLGDPTSLMSARPRFSDLVPAGWFSESVRDRTRNAFPASLSRTWGEAAWTAPDLWSHSPIFATARASAALSALTPDVDLEAQRRRTYRRLKQAVEERRTREEIAEEAPPEAEAELEIEGSPTPTGAMLALGATVVSWTATVVVIAFALVVILLGIELGIVDVIQRR